MSKRKTVPRVELRMRRTSVAAEEKGVYGESTSSPRAAAEIVKSILRHEAVEVFVVLLLDVKNNVVGYHEAARGSIDACPVDPRSVYRAAILAGASCVIVAHNHPSGDPTPSVEDLALTERLRRAGELLGVALLDHVVVAESRHVSLRESGYLQARST